MTHNQASFPAVTAAEAPGPSLAVIVRDWLAERQIIVNGAWPQKPLIAPLEDYSAGDLVITALHRAARLKGADPEPLAKALAMMLRTEHQLIAESVRGYVNVRVPDKLLFDLPQTTRWWTQLPTGPTAEPIGVRVLLPQEGVRRLGLLRYVVFPLMHALSIVQAKGIGSVQVVVGDAVYDVGGFGDVIEALQKIAQALFGKGMRSPKVASGAFEVNAPHVKAQHEWLWVAEDRDISSSKGRRDFRASDYTLGCDRLLLLHVPADEDDAFLYAHDLPRDSHWWTSFILYSLSPCPGSDFVPSACALQGQEDFKTWLKQLQHSLRRFIRADSGQILPSGVSMAPASKGQREVLVKAALLPGAWTCSAQHGDIKSFGYLLHGLLQQGQRIANRPDLRTRTESGDESAIGLFSCIYQALSGVLTMVER